MPFIPVNCQFFFPLVESNPHGLSIMIVLFAGKIVIKFLVMEKG